MIKDEVNEVQVPFENLVKKFFDDTADQEQVMEIAAEAWITFQEARDIKDLDPRDLVIAIFDIMLTTLVHMKDEFATYSDEVVEDPVE